MDAKAAVAAVEAIVEADRRDSGARGRGEDADGGDDSRVGGVGSDRGAGRQWKTGVEDMGRGAVQRQKVEEESGNGMADEEEMVVRRRMPTAKAARMHPLKERRLGKYRAAMVTSWSAWPLSCKKQQSTSRREKWEA